MQHTFRKWRGNTGRLVAYTASLSSIPNSRLTTISYDIDRDCDWLRMKLCFRSNSLGIPVLPVVKVTRA